MKKFVLALTFTVLLGNARAYAVKADLVDLPF
jgi:hypothetical protein